MKEKVMNGLEKFSKAMLSPLSYISAAGLILVLGALLTSTSLSAMIPVLQWTPIKLLGQLIYNCIMVIINNLSLMFCVGIAAALAKKNKQQAAIIGLMSYFMYLTACFMWRLHVPRSIAICLLPRAGLNMERWSSVADRKSVV